MKKDTIDQLFENRNGEFDVHKTHHCDFQIIGLWYLFSRQQLIMSLRL